MPAVAPMNACPDPRRYPPPGTAGGEASTLHDLAARSLASGAALVSDPLEEAIASRIEAILDRGDGAALAALFGSAPTLAVYRHLWRCLVRLTGAVRRADVELAVTLFAIPVVIVAGSPAGAQGPAPISGRLADLESLVAVLRDHGALAGNQSFALSGALVRAEAIDLASLPAVHAARKFAGGSGFAPLDLAPGPVELSAGERAHLRFLVGSALAAPGADLLADTGVGRWGMPLSKALTSQLAAPGATVVALPRAAMALPVAVAKGRAAQREVSAQLFASHALRELRASVGEPVAIISAHTAASAPRGGELRLSLSSPFSPRDAYGFQSPLYPEEAVADVATTLVDLLRDCRVADVRIVDGVHADRDAVTGGPLLFKPETHPGGRAF